MELKALIKLISDYMARNYNGKLTISFRNGKIQPIAKKSDETIKIY